MINMKSQLSELLTYKNERVIERFSRDFPQKADNAEDLFVDLLNYLWLCKKHEVDRANNKNENLNFVCVMHEEMRDIDNMWHTFILFTKDYHAFCNHFFGEYLHHVPNMRDELSFSLDEFKAQLYKFLSFAYDNLGDAVVRRWFASSL